MDSIQTWHGHPRAHSGHDHTKNFKIRATIFGLSWAFAKKRMRKAEAHMSHRAMEDVYELHQFSQQPANFAAEFQDSSEESDDLGPAVAPKVWRKKQRKAEKDKNSTNRTQPSPVLQHHVCRMNNKTVVIGGTPPATRREHFAALAKTLGCSQEELADRVLQASTEDRWDMLHTFYRNRDADLGEIFKELRPQGEKTEEER